MEYLYPAYLKVNPFLHQTETECFKLNVFISEMSLVKFVYMSLDIN